jgi:hypothetical protein
MKTQSQEGQGVGGFRVVVGLAHNSFLLDHQITQMVKVLAVFCLVGLLLVIQNF